MRNPPVPVSESDFIEAQESYTGWCTNCEAFTTGSVEPDATNYKCDECRNLTVFGAEEALLENLITIEDDL